MDCHKRAEELRGQSITASAMPIRRFSKNLSAAFSKVRVWGLPGIVSFIRRKMVGFIQRRRLLACVRASKISEPSRGITVIGELTTQVSLSKTLRDFILDLKDAKIPCQTFDTCLRSHIPEADAAKIVTPRADFDIGRYSHIVMMYRCPLPGNVLPHCRRVRVTFYDSEHGIHEMLPFLRESGDDIVAMSDFNFEYFKREFPRQGVFKVTYPFRFKLQDATPREVLRAKYGLAADDFVVFFNFDFGSYYRKNIPAAVRAFALAFAGDAKAKLLFKTKGSTANPRQLKEMLDCVAECGVAEQFVHIPQYLPRADVDGLTAACDAYLSLHKSEGFGIGMAEAMSQGKPVVATDWSANTEFCSPDTAWCVPYRMVPILSHEYPVEMKEWAEADVDAAAAALREIRANPLAAAARAAVGKNFIKSHFSVESFKRDIEAVIDG